MRFARPGDHPQKDTKGPLQQTLSFQLREIDDTSAHMWLGTKCFLAPAKEMMLHNGLLFLCIKVIYMLKSLCTRSDIYLLYW